MNLKEKNWHQLDIPEGKVNDYAITHMNKPSGSVLSTGNLRTAFYGQPSANLIFEYPTRWHELSYDGGTWMTDLPIEQSQHDREMAPIQGNVLVGGLGLGYALTVLRDNPKVRNVTVVEKSPEVIELVWKHLRIPRDRFSIVNQDLFEFLEQHDQRGCGPMVDYCFYDIWQSDGEATFHDVVCKLRKMTHENGICFDANVICWNEDVMRRQLMHGLQSRLFWLHDKPELKLLRANTIITLEQLCETHDDVYWDWMVQFWRDLRDKRFSLTDAPKHITQYCQLVGRPGWEEEWEGMELE